MSRGCVLVFLAITVFARPAAGPEQRHPHPPRTLRLAEQEILALIAVEASPKGRSLCIETPIACVGPDRGDLALSSIASQDTVDSRICLARLVRFGLDGALAEDYDCEVLAKGPEMAKVLTSLSPAALEKQCHGEFRGLMKTWSPELEGLKEETVCRGAAEIEREIREAVTAIKAGRVCQE